jgi:hypothetical protein
VLAQGILWLAAAIAAPAAAVEDAAKPVEIQLDAPEGCSTPDAFYGFLHSRTNRVRPAENGERRTTLQVRLTRARGQILGELRMVDDHGGTDTRKVHGASCDEVVQALSLTAALALDPAALLTVPAATASANPESTAPTPPAAAESAVRATLPPPAATAAVQPETTLPVPGFELAAGPVAMTAAAGSLSPGIAVSARKSFGKEGVLLPSFGLDLAYVRNDLVQSPQQAQVALASLGVTACPLRLPAGRLALRPCVLLLGGWLSATGRQVTHVSTVDRSWLSAGATLRASVFLGLGFWLEAEGGASLPLLRRRFYTTLPSNVVAETPTVSPVVGLRLTHGW